MNRLMNRLMNKINDKLMEINVNLKSAKRALMY